MYFQNITLQQLASEYFKEQLDDIMSFAEYKSYKEEMGFKVVAENKEMVNHPSHYNRENAMECIEEMKMIFGLQVTADFCMLSAYKYRYRAGQKGDAMEDLRKSDWYINEYANIKKELESKSVSLPLHSYTINT